MAVPFDPRSLNIPNLDQIRRQTQQYRTTPGRTAPAPNPLLGGGAAPAVQPTQTPSQPAQNPLAAPTPSTPTPTQGTPQGQAPAAPQGAQPNPLLGGIVQNALTPITGGPQVTVPTQAPTLNPGPAVQPYQPVSPTAPVAFSGPSDVSYQGTRVDPSQQFSINRDDIQSRLPSMNDYQGDIDAVEQATFKRALNRINPYLDDQRKALEQRLANQGLQIGGEAYNRELDRWEQGRGDALENLALSAVGAGRQEHSRLTGLGQSLRGQEWNERLGQAGFNAGEAGRNFRERLAGEQLYGGQQQFADQFRAAQARAADQQAIQQNQFGDNFRAGQAQFGAQHGLAANQQNFGQRLAAAGFNRDSSQQNFGNQMAARGQWFGEQQYNRNQPLNNLGAILAGTGVAQPGFESTPTYGPMGVDYSGNYRYEQNRPSAWGQFGRGLLGAASGALSAYWGARGAR